MVVEHIIFTHNDEIDLRRVKPGEDQFLKYMFKFTIYKNRINIDVKIECLVI